MIRVLRVACLLGLATLAWPAEAAEWRERRTGELGVPLPSGAGWEVQTQEGGGWQALRVRRDATGAPVVVHAIGVYAHTVPEKFSDWLPVEVATEYLLWEIENMRAQGVDTAQYSLEGLDVFEEERGGRVLHALRNVKRYGAADPSGIVLEEQELYLVFLPDFADTVTFYKIFLTAFCVFEECRLDDLGLEEMRPLLDGLADRSAED